MIRRENPNFVASIYAPNPKEVTYWIDLTEGPDGQIIKSFVNNKWVKVNEDKNDEQDADISELQQKVTTLETAMPKKVGKVSITGSGVAVSSASISGDTLTLNKNYTLPTANATTIGGVKSSTTGTTADRDYLVEVNADGTMKVNVPWTDANTTYNIATDSTLGLVKIGYTENGKNYPVELDGDNKMFVNVPWTDTNTTYVEATGSAAGLMSAADKTKLNGIAANANNYTLPAASSTAIGGVRTGTAVTDLAGTEDAAAICTKINSLLASLRTAGVLAA